MKVVTPFESFSYWAQSPWWFINMSLRFVQSWQDECYSRLRLLSGVAPAPVVHGSHSVSDELALLQAEIASKQGRETPVLGCLQGVAVVGGPTAESKEAPKLVEKPKSPPVAAKERIDEVAPVADAQSGSVTSMLAMQAKSLAKAVKRGAGEPAVPAKAPRKSAAKKPAVKTAAKASEEA